MTSKRAALQKKVFLHAISEKWTKSMKLDSRTYIDLKADLGILLPTANHLLRQFQLHVFIKSIAVPHKHEWLINMPTYLCVGGDLMMVGYQEIFSLRISRLKYSFKSERERQCWPSNQDETVYTVFLPKFSGEHWSNTEAVIAFFPFFFFYPKLENCYLRPLTSDEANWILT